MALSGRTDIRHTFVAGADLRGQLYRFATLNASDLLVVAGAGDRAYVLVEDVDVGQSGTVVLHGKAKVVLGGSVDALDELASNAAGAAVLAAGAGTVVNAIALESGVAGDVIEVLTTNGKLSA